MTIINFYDIFKQLIHLFDILKTREEFHFEKSGNDINVLDSNSICSIFVTLEIFHFEISGNVINELHLLKIKLKLFV